MSIQEKYNYYKEDLEMLTENMDKYQYLIDLGSKNSMPAEFRIETFIVPGCMSQVWLVPKFENNLVSFMADSDAHITKGVATLVADIFSNATKEEIQNKKESIKNVLIEDDISTHKSRLSKSGFTKFGIWLQHFNFASFIAVK